MPICSKELWVTMMPSQSPLAILAVRSLRRARVKSSFPAISSLAFGYSCINSLANCSSMWLGTTYIGFLRSPGLLHLHARSRHYVGLARAHGMGQQSIPTAHAPPHGVFLMRIQRNGLVHPRKIQVRTVEAPQA